LEEKPIARLLVVDDEQDIISILTQGLKAQRFRVDAFTDPFSAFEHFEANSREFCLMLSDIRMPGMSGLELARKVRSTNPEVKILLMSAFEIYESEFSRVFPSTKIDGVVKKPASIPTLKAEILKHIGQIKRFDDEQP
jgi:two-component system, cell cycle sensor histidine kinase and response regulator CckA